MSVSYEHSNKDDLIRYSYENETCTVEDCLFKYKEEYHFDSGIIIDIPLREKVIKINSHKNYYCIPRINKKFDSDKDAIKFSKERLIRYLDKMIPIIEKSLENIKDMRNYIENSI